MSTSNINAYTHAAADVISQDKTHANLLSIKALAQLVNDANFPPEKLKLMQQDIQSLIREELERSFSASITVEYLRKKSIEVALLSIQKDLQANIAKNIMTCNALFPSKTSKEFLILLGEELVSKNFFVKAIPPRILPGKSGQYIGFKVSIYKFED